MIQVKSHKRIKKNGVTIVRKHARKDITESTFFKPGAKMRPTSKILKDSGAEKTVEFLHEKTKDVDVPKHAKKYSKKDFKNTFKVKR